MFDPVDPKQSLPDVERGILQYWREEDVFKRSVQQRNGASVTGRSSRVTNDQRPETFSFYDGPPFATGLPHYGHLLPGTIKDVIPRYRTMRGDFVERRFGWDCHGLPIENLVEQENDLGDRQKIESLGIGAFNDLCRATVQRYTKEWKSVMERMGRWVDMDWDYRTMDPEFMESIWWVFQRLHEKGLIYEGHKPMHICPRCVTPLSNFEVTQNYKEISDMGVIAKFELADEPGTFVLAWTTTGWTLPGNLLLAVGSKIKYVKIKSDGESFILAEDRVAAILKDREYQIEKNLKAKELIGKRYRPLFPYFAEQYKNAYKIVSGDFVATDEGTGVVHIAPGFGEDDFALGKKEKLSLLQHVTMEGKFKPVVTDFAGQSVKPKNDPSKTDRKIAEWLENKNLLFTKESYKHSYPHCWRCDTPLLNYATSSWFVAVEKLKDKLLANNSKTEWVPAHIRDGRFGNWLENARDWAISRNRFWGTPLPVWRSKQGDLEVIGSRDALMERARIRFTKLTAVRHGESEGNLTPIYQGVAPGTDLTTAGKKQASETGKHLKEQNVTMIYASPLARTRQTAEAIAKATGATVIVDERLREVTFGEYEGKTIDFTDLSLIKARRAHKLETGAPESIYHFPGMETWSEVQARTSEFMREMLPKHRGEHVVIVTHADPLQNVRHFFTREDPVKISHQPYPLYAEPFTFFWDHDREAAMDLHIDRIDDITWGGSPGPESVDVTLVRHGETAFNKEKKIQGGDADHPLNETGQNQALQTAKQLKGKKFDVVVTSDRKRAAETAAIIAKELGIKQVDAMPLLRERTLGKWSGRTMEEVIKDHAVPIKGINAAIHPVTPEGGESLSAFLARARGARDELLKRYTGKKILLVSHRGTMQALMTVTQNLSLAEAVAARVENAQTVKLALHQPLRRIPEVLDCWFESGSMPYAQSHFPFNQSTWNLELGTESVTSSKFQVLPPGFPADFIAEGIDQTRGWFYTLTVLATALYDEPAFRHCVVNGIVLAEDGKKMSKRLKNYPEPMELVEKYGADAIRLTLMSSPAVRGEDLRMSEKLVAESLRNVLLPLWNTYSFFVTYANAADFQPVSDRQPSTHPLDQWIRAEVQDLVNRMTQQLDRYDLSATCAELDDTIDALTNWYVRLSRRRFAGKTEQDDDGSAASLAQIDVTSEQQHEALETLYDVLLTLVQALAPFTPFITDAVYLNLTAAPHGSVHLTDWPATRPLSKAEQTLLRKNRLLRLIVSLGLSVRSEAKVRTRQPLAAATIAIPPAFSVETRRPVLSGVEGRHVSTDDGGIGLSQEDLNLLKQELNVKNLKIINEPGQLADAYAQVDARAVGPRLGARVQEIIKAGKAGEFAIGDDGMVRILDEVLAPNEVKIVYRGKEGQNVAADHGVVVSLATNVTDALRLEGQARDLIRAVQKLRKDAGLSFTDRITLHVEGLDDVMKTHGDLVIRETRATIGAVKDNGQTVEVGDTTVIIHLHKM